MFITIKLVLFQAFVHHSQFHGKEFAITMISIQEHTLQIDWDT